MATINHDDRIKKLIDTIKNSPYLDPIEQRKLCENLELSYKKHLFSKEYRNRYYIYLFKHTTTTADVVKKLGIPHKYFCQCKRYYEKRDLIKVVGFGICPATGSDKVQFLSTNPQKWETIKNANL